MIRKSQTSQTRRKKRYINVQGIKAYIVNIKEKYLRIRANKFMPEHHTKCPVAVRPIKVKEKESHQISLPKNASGFRLHGKIKNDHLMYAETLLELLFLEHL